MNRSILVLMTVVLPAWQAATQAASIGDPAPPLPIESWVKGAPFKIIPGTNIYVVEFWATWCPPCRASIPHLTAVQKKFADQGVVVVGVSDEDLATVRPFVSAQGANMDYRVAVDSSKRCLNYWHTAFGADGIPHAFIVGTNGTVLWHDFPSENLDRALHKILNGTFDLERAKNFEMGERLVLNYTAIVKRPNAITNAAPLGDKILENYAKDWRIPHRLGRAILTDTEVRSRDLKLALRATTKSTEMTEGQSSDALEMLARAQFATGSKAEAIETIKKALTVCDSEDKPGLEKLQVFYENGLKRTK